MEDIAKQALSRYSQDGVVSLSFGLLLVALLYYAWQQNKQAASERSAFLAAAEKKSEEYMGHVVSFVEATNASTAATQKAAAAVEQLTGEVRGVKDGMGRIAERVDRLDGRKP